VAEVLGPWFTKENLPLTAKLLRRVYEDARLVNDRAKNLNARPRPPLADPHIRPCVRLPATPSYPSGHSTNAFVWAGVLSELFPEKRADLTAWAHRYAWGRIIAGVHFPSDDVAGRVLAAALLKEFLKSPVFQADLERARNEARPYLIKKAA
jgi:acid phosphatase (class A)